ncbi:hypothetical protein Slin15195_G083620 [Septoria linicola]|uniref:Cyanovirin-N domain-containing protein n=1 Tax=Septoria linicola TaxID=215465 RepID=A0A9Q9AXK0_9PEZI|nr:hypothetical protein Slin15195_G083620 [Septoria linicola]
MQITPILSLTLGLLGVASAQNCQNNTLYCGRNLKNNFGWNNNRIFNALVNKDGSNGGPSRDDLDGNFNGAILKCVRPDSQSAYRLKWVVSCGNSNCATVQGSDAYCRSKDRCED